MADRPGVANTQAKTCRNTVTPVTHHVTMTITLVYHSVTLSSSGCTACYATMHGMRACMACASDLQAAWQCTFVLLVQLEQYIILL